MEEASDLESELGGRATVTALVTRTQLPKLTIELHRLLSGVDFDLRQHDVLLPGSTRSFGLVAGSAWKPAQGVIEDLRSSGRSAVRVKGEVFWIIPISNLGTYFGWNDPSGVRVQFHTQDGDDYAVTITYDALPEHDEARKFFPLIQLLLTSGRQSVAMALTPAAAERWWLRLSRGQRIWQAIGSYFGWTSRRLAFDTVKLVEDPPKERVLTTRQRAEKVVTTSSRWGMRTLGRRNKRQ